MSKITTLGIGCLGVLLSGCAGWGDPPHPDHPDPADEDEVPVAYGSQDKEDVTGAVSSVSMDDTEHMHDVLEMLRSQIPGLQVTERSDGSFRLRLRGAHQSLRSGDESNQPLLVIDGMPVLSMANGLGLKGLNPKEIESISVLRDVSSTSVYGSKGANGVILIRLKR